MKKNTVTIELTVEEASIMLEICRMSLTCKGMPKEVETFGIKLACAGMEMLMADSVAEVEEAKGQTDAEAN